MFKVEKFMSNNGFFIYDEKINRRRSTPEMSQIFNIEIDEYLKILQRCFSISEDIEHRYHFFNTREDAEKALNTLEPYLIMEKLVGD